MTEIRTQKVQRYTPALLGIFCLFFLLLLLRRPSLASSGVLAALQLCAKSLIPALFPFMVLSELLLSLDFGNFFGRAIATPFTRLLGVSEEGAAALCLGFLFGFPTGARILLQAMDAGSIDKKECERLLGLASPPSIAFLISFVGSSLCQNQRFGICLWSSCLISSLLLGLLTKKEGVRTCRTPSHSEKKPLASVFTSAMSSALGATLLICSHVVFFGIICDCLTLVFSTLELPPSLRTLAFALTELTAGVKSAASLPHAPLRGMLCGFSVGFSGLSVHLQLLSLADGKGLSFLPYIKTKLAIGVLCAALMLALFPLWR